MRADPVDKTPNPEIPNPEIPNPRPPGLKPEEWSVYIVECRDGSLYTGIAKDVARRVATHNKGRGAKYTRTRGPVRLLYSRAGFAHGDALRRERTIKNMGREGKLKLAANGPALVDAQLMDAQLVDA